jgi:hypothetical protein
MIKRLGSRGLKEKKPKKKKAEVERLKLMLPTEWSL